MFKTNYTLLYFLALFCSCSLKEDDSFNLKNKEQLEDQFKEFIVHVKAQNDEELKKYRCDTVLWYNMGVEKYGTPALITPDFSLGNILELSNLGFDSLVVHGDTVGVIYNQKELELHGGTFIRWQYFDFILKDGKIAEILRHNTSFTKMDDFIRTQRPPRELNRQITIGGFYMDDTEITSNDYEGSAYNEYCESYKIYPDDYDTTFQERKSKKMYEELSKYHYLDHDSTGNFSQRVASLKESMKANLETFWANFPVSLASISVESMSTNSFRTRDLKENR